MHNFFWDTLYVQKLRSREIDFRSFVEVNVSITALQNSADWDMTDIQYHPISCHYRYIQYRSIYSLLQIKLYTFILELQCIDISITRPNEF